MEESIYNLIPKEYVPPPKEPLYKSKFSPYVLPTGSTIGLHTTSVPGVANLSGDYVAPVGPHSNKALYTTLGKPKGSLKPNAQEFMRKGTGLRNSMKLPSLNGSQNNTEERPRASSGDFKYDDKFRKPPIPKIDEQPIMGLVSKKNYVLANTVDAILSQPRAQEEEVDYLKKKNFGKVPKYLKQIKDNIQREYDHIRTMRQAEQEEQEKQRYLLSDEEVRTLREGLKKKWEAVNKDYQQITHISKLDTVGLRRRKEECERQLAEIEKDLEKLNKQYIFIDTTA